VILAYALVTQNSELRIESAANADVSVTVRSQMVQDQCFCMQVVQTTPNLPCIPMPQLLDGSAEIFGAELQKGSKMSISGQKLAVGTRKEAGISLRRLLQRVVRRSQVSSALTHMCSAPTSTGLLMDRM
jgi:hypothetical protein